MRLILALASALFAAPSFAQVADFTPPPLGSPGVTQRADLAAELGHIESLFNAVANDLADKIEASLAGPTGLSLLAAASPGAARSTLGLGSAALAASADFAAALHVHGIVDVTGLQAALDAKVDDSQISAFGLTFVDDANASVARTTLGLGTLATQSGTFSGSSSGNNTGDQTITLSGDVAGSGTGAITATVQANAVALTTDTTGNYVAGVTGGLGIGVTGTAGEGWSPTVALSATGATDEFCLTFEATGPTTEWQSCGGGGGATNLSYTASTRLLESDTGTDVTLPLAGVDAGLMSAADKTKLDGVATGATANSSDAALRARASHTGDDLTGAYGIADSTDSTKRVTFDASSLSTGITRTLTFPNNSGQIIISAGVQTFSGVKTFSVPPVFATPTTSIASANFPHGVAPSSPVNGDFWTTTGGVFVRVNGATLQLDNVAAPATNLTYTASTRALASSTGTAATLPLVSSAEAGLAPASGGGTTNFLRADGAWAAPEGGGGGVSVLAATPSSDQANWAPAGFGTGRTIIKAQPTTNSFIGGLAGGTADQEVTLVNDSSFVIMLISEDANSTATNRITLKRGSYIILPQESLTLRYSGTVSRWLKAGMSRDLYEVGNTTQLTLPQSGTAVQNMGIGSVNTLATLSTINSTATPTNDFDEYSRTQITNSTASGGSSIRGMQAWVYRGATSGRQGFLHTARVRFAALGATGGVWSGLLNTTASTLTQPSGITNSLLLAADGGDTTLRIMSNDGSGVATEIDLGANFPVPSASAAYEYLFFSAPNGTRVEYMVRRLDSRQMAQGSLTTDIPATNTALTHWLGLMVGATAAANTAQANYLLTVGL